MTHLLRPRGISLALLLGMAALLISSCGGGGSGGPSTASNAASVSTPQDSTPSAGTTPTSTTTVTVPPTPQEPVPADAIWVATTGNDTSGAGTQASPYKTLSKGISRLSAGGTLVVKAGLYTGSANFINQQMHPFPNGSAQKLTTIRAESPYSVRIENAGPLNYYDNALFITGNYIKVDGFVFVQKDTAYPPFVGQVDGNFVKITRSIFKRQGEAEQYGGFFYVGGNNNLMEDLAGVGHARYGFNAGGPDATQSKNIFRRIVARVDYISSAQPKAAFSIYGNNDLPIRVKDFLVQNLIVIDGQMGPTAGDTVYGGVYNPKNTENLKFYGSIVLNNRAEYAGFFLAEYPASKSIHLVNSVAWGNLGTSFLAGVRANNNGGDTLWNQLTIGQNPYAFYADIIGAQNRFSDSLLLGNPNLSSTGSAGFTGGYSQVATAANPALRYIVDRESNISGAKILTRYGVDGTSWGEPGYDQTTNVPLWPWPYEDQIKAVFAEPNPVPAGAVPAVNNTQRGFCAPGVDAYGKPHTLTRYIWQTLGNRIPASIYGD